MEQENRAWKFFAGGMFFVLLGASILAYLHGIPSIIKKIPYYDSIGHFVLFGLFALALDRILRRRFARVFGVSISYACLLVALYALIDESLQILSANRTFSLQDLTFSLLGIALIPLCYSMCFDKKKNSIEMQEIEKAV